MTPRSYSRATLIAAEQEDQQDEDERLRASDDQRRAIWARSFATGDRRRSRRLDVEHEVARRSRRPRPSSPGSSGSPSSVRACQSSPWTKTRPTGASASRTTPTGRRARSCPVDDRRSPHLDDLRRRRAPISAGERRGDRERDAAARPGTPSPAGSKSSSAPNTKQTAPASVSAPWLGDERLGDEEAEREQHQQEPGPADRQHLEAEEAEDQRDRADRAREDQARVPELDDDPEHPERQKQRRSGSGRSACRGCAARATCRRRRSRRPPCAGRAPSARSSCRRSCSGARAGSGAMTSITFCASASVAPRFDALRTAASAQATLRPCARASSRSEAAASLIDLAPQVGLDVLAADVDRRRRADVRLRRHRERRPRPGRSRRRPRRPARRAARRRRSPAPSTRAPS